MSFRVGGALALIAAVLLAVSIATPTWWSGPPTVDGHEHATQQVSIGLAGGEGCNTGGDGTCKRILLGGGFKTLTSVELGAGALTGLLAIALAAAALMARPARRRLGQVAYAAGPVVALLAIALAAIGPDMIKAPSGTTVPIGLGAFAGIAGGLLVIAAGWLGGRPMTVRPRPLAAPPLPGYAVDPWMQQPPPPPLLAAPPPPPPPSQPPTSPGGMLTGPSGPLMPLPSAPPSPMFAIAMAPAPPMPPPMPRVVAASAPPAPSPIRRPPPPPVALPARAAPPPFVARATPPRAVPPLTKPPVPARQLPIPPAPPAGEDDDDDASATAIRPEREHDADSEEGRTTAERTDVGAAAFSDNTSPSLAPAPDDDSAPEEAETSAVDRVSASQLSADETVPVERPSASIVTSSPRPPPLESAAATEPTMAAANSATDQQVVVPTPAEPDDDPPRDTASTIEAVSEPAPAAQPPAPKHLAAASAPKGPSPACPQCDAPMAWVEEHLRFYCKSCKMYF